jgi:hypothetical protein
MLQLLLLLLLVLMEMLLAPCMRSAAVRCWAKQLVLQGQCQLGSAVPGQGKELLLQMLLPGSVEGILLVLLTWPNGWHQVARTCRQQFLLSMAPFSSSSSSKWCCTAARVLGVTAGSWATR